MKKIKFKKTYGSSYIDSKNTDDPRNPAQILMSGFRPKMDKTYHVRFVTDDLGETARYTIVVMEMTEVDESSEKIIS